MPQLQDLVQAPLSTAAGIYSDPGKAASTVEVFRGLASITNVYAVDMSRVAAFLPRSPTPRG